MTGRDNQGRDHSPPEVGVNDTETVSVTTGSLKTARIVHAVAVGKVGTPTISVSIIWMVVMRVIVVIPKSTTG